MFTYLCPLFYFLNIIHAYILIHFYFTPTANIPSKTPPPRSETFMEIQLGKTSTSRIGAFGYWNYQFHLRNPSLVKFNYTLSNGASLGVYGRRDGVPTHTRYDFFEILKPKGRRSKRSEKVRFFFPFYLLIFFINLRNKLLINFIVLNY